MADIAAKKFLFRQLQKEVQTLQGSRKPSENHCFRTGLGPIEQAFPEGVFPTGTTHEFISQTEEDAASTNGFIAGLLGKLMKSDGMCLWISTQRTIFPPALSLFGLVPDKIVFIDTVKRKDALWAIEEGLKCSTLAAVIGELKELSFTESRRLQLAVEQSRVTGLIHRFRPKSENTVACIARWKVKPLASETEEGMPGPGYPAWQVQLAKVRNGTPGTWEVAWTTNGFRLVNRSISLPEIQNRKFG